MASASFPPGSTFGDFTILSPLGEGEDRVYLAEQRTTGKRRALKLMSPDLVRDPRLARRFEQAGRVAATIPSEHVAEVVGVGVDESSQTPWIAMELLEGENLLRWRAKRSDPSRDEVRLLLEQLCHALGAAHEAGIVHGALQPSKLFVAKSLHAGAPFTLKVLGFGIAQLLNEIPEHTPRQETKPEGVRWMAPEQLEPSAPMGPPTDVWALGLCAFFLLTGKSFWRSANQLSPAEDAIRKEVAQDPIPSATARAREYACETRLPPEFDAWFARCVARAPGARFRDAREAFASLDPLLRSVDSAFRVAAPPPGFAGGFHAPSGPAFGASPGFGSNKPPGAFGSSRQPPPGAFGSFAQPFPSASPWGESPPPPKSSNGLIFAVIGLVVGLFVLILVFMVGAGVFLGYRSAAVSRSVATPVAVADQGPVPVDANDGVWGDADAPVTVVVFGEYECPFCGKINGTLDQVKSQYGRSDVRVVWKHFPLDFHKSARPAAVAAATVRSLGGDDAFWSFHRSAMGDQKSLTDDNFERWAVIAGVDGREFNHAYAARLHQSEVDEDIALGKSIGVTGTPASFINGVMVSGAQPLDKITQVIDDQLREARAEIASGTPRTRVYAVMSEQNYRTPPPTEAKKEEKKVDETTVWKVPVGDSPMRGPGDALVTIVLFSEYQCPFCQRVEGTLDKVREHYGSDVRIVWKDRPLPFHKQAVPAAQFAREARKQKGDRGYWEAHDLLFANNTQLTQNDLEKYARQLGLDVSAVQRAIQHNIHQKAIDADADLADALDARGTPTMFINGRQLRGAQPFEKFQTIIDAELSKAKAMVGEGTSRSRVYEKIMAGARSPGSAEPPERVEIPSPSDANPWKGAASGKIVVQVFGDFQCPYCARLDPTLDELIEAYPGRVRVVWRHLPLPMHENAMLAAEASVEVYRQKGNKGFWAFQDLVLQNQEALSRVDLEGYAERVGADIPAFRAALDDGRHRAVVDGDAAIARVAGISATPTTVVNGELVKGAQSFDKFRRVVDGMK
jgi:protein-disulfide isomerase/serine/threonine protein kinase